MADYRLDLLSSDVASLIQHLLSSTTGLSPNTGAFVVGHDWGGAVAWNLAMKRPDLVRRLAILNAPHPYFFLNKVRSTCPTTDKGHEAEIQVSLFIWAV